jgi:hypothetical protein
MQWYPAHGPARSSTEPDSVATGVADLSDAPPAGPRWQVQRVFNAANEEVREQIHKFAAHRDSHESPYGWRKYIQSQELYVRYCGWATIRTMLRLDQNDRTVAERHEAKS